MVLQYRSKRRGFHFYVQGQVRLKTAKLEAILCKFFSATMFERLNARTVLRRVLGIKLLQC